MTLYDKPGRARFAIHPHTPSRLISLLNAPLYEALLHWCHGSNPKAVTSQRNTAQVASTSQVSPVGKKDPETDQSHQSTAFLLYHRWLGLKTSRGRDPRRRSDRAGCDTDRPPHTSFWVPCWSYGTPHQFKPSSFSAGGREGRKGRQSPTLPTRSLTSCCLLVGLQGAPGLLVTTALLEWSYYSQLCPG